MPDWMIVQRALWFIASHAGLVIGSDMFEYNGDGKDSGWVRHSNWKLSEHKGEGWRYQADWRHPFDKHQGTTHMTADWLSSMLSGAGWGARTYRLLAHNCWNFCWRIRNTLL
jgi:hypothetical protein